MATTPNATLSTDVTAITEDRLRALHKIESESKDEQEKEKAQHELICHYLCNNPAFKNPTLAMQLLERSNSTVKEKFRNHYETNEPLRNLVFEAAVSSADPLTRHYYSQFIFNLFIENEFEKAILFAENKSSSLKVALAMFCYLSPSTTRDLQMAFFWGTLAQKDKQTEEDAIAFLDRLRTENPSFIPDNDYQVAMHRAILKRPSDNKDAKERSELGIQNNIYQELNILADKQNPYACYSLCVRCQWGEDFVPWRIGSSEFNNYIVFALSYIPEANYILGMHKLKIIASKTNPTTNPSSASEQKTREKETSLTFIRLAAEKGVPGAQYALFEHHYQKSKYNWEWLEEAAASGYPIAQKELARLLFESEFFHKDNARAFFWHSLTESVVSKETKFREVLEKVESLPIEQKRMDERTKVVAQTLREYQEQQHRGQPAAKFPYFSKMFTKNLQQLADKGDVTAQAELAERCYAELLNANDKKEVYEQCKMTFDYASKAAQQGNARAQFILYRCYCQGIGTAVNEGLQLQWLEESAGNSNFNAQEHLAAFYYLSKNPIRNVIRAYIWFKEAIANGHKDSRGFLKQLEDEIQAYDAKMLGSEVMLFTRVQKPIEEASEDNKLKRDHPIPNYSQRMFQALALQLEQGGNLKSVRSPIPKSVLQYQLAMRYKLFEPANQIQYQHWMEQAAANGNFEAIVHLSDSSLAITDGKSEAETVRREQIARLEILIKQARDAYSAKSKYIFSFAAWGIKPRGFLNNSLSVVAGEIMPLKFLKYCQFLTLEEEGLGILISSLESLSRDWHSPKISISFALEIMVSELFNHSIEGRRQAGAGRIRKLKDACFEIFTFIRSLPSKQPHLFSSKLDFVEAYHDCFVETRELIERHAAVLDTVSKPGNASKPKKANEKEDGQRKSFIDFLAARRKILNDNYEAFKAEQLQYFSAQQALIKLYASHERNLERYYTSLELKTLQDLKQGEQGLDILIRNCNEHRVKIIEITKALNHTLEILRKPDRKYSRFIFDHTAGDFQRGLHAKQREQNEAERKKLLATLLEAKRKAEEKRQKELEEQQKRRAAQKEAWKKKLKEERIARAKNSQTQKKPSAVISKPTPRPKPKEHTLSSAAAIPSKMQDKETSVDLVAFSKEAELLATELKQFAEVDTHNENVMLRQYAALGMFAQILEAMRRIKLDPMLALVASELRNTLYHGERDIIPEIDLASDASESKGQQETNAVGTDEKMKAEQTSSDEINDFADAIMATNALLLSAWRSKNFSKLLKLPPLLIKLALHPRSLKNQENLSAEELCKKLVQLRTRNKIAPPTGEDCVQRLDFYVKQLASIRKYHHFEDDLAIDKVIRYIKARMGKYASHLREIDSKRHRRWLDQNKFVTRRDLQEGAALRHNHRVVTENSISLQKILKRMRALTLSPQWKPIDSEELRDFRKTTLGARLISFDRSNPPPQKHSPAEMDLKGGQDMKMTHENLGLHAIRLRRATQYKVTEPNTTEEVFIVEFLFSAQHTLLENASPERDPVPIHKSLLLHPTMFELRRTVPELTRCMFLYRTPKDSIHPNHFLTDKTILWNHIAFRIEEVGQTISDSLFNFMATEGIIAKQDADYFNLLLRDLRASKKNVQSYTLPHCSQIP